MRSRNPTIMMLVLAVLVACLVLELLPLHRAACGHKIPLAAVWFPKRLPHHCECGAVLQQMQLIRDDYARFMPHGPPDSTLHTADYGVTIGATSVPIHINYSGPNFSGKPFWECRVKRASILPGNYLMTADGVTYFSEDHEPTTHDPVLPKWAGPPS